jgi:beta-lactamase superfamily II metal-dependent hydrolase
MVESYRFAGFPSAVVYDHPLEDKKAKPKPVQHLLWGDWLKLTGPEGGDWVQVHARNADGYMHKDKILKERILEIIFVDIGQGDGCLIVTPDDKQIIVDAGQTDNMSRFLNWRFGQFKKEFTFESAIISHPDADHYAGFKQLFHQTNVKFQTIFHNGIAGEPDIKKTGNVQYVSNIVTNKDELDNLKSDNAYVKMLKKALASGRVNNIQMLSAASGYLPGYGTDKPLSIKVLGPVPEPSPEGKTRLRWFGNIGKTKNGHSIILRLKYDHVSVLLGGDLNSVAEYFLLEHYTGFPAPPDTGNEEKFMELARKTFESDVAKSCHHGSSDFTDLFLQAVNPVATIISSGDNEPYSHPRSDTLGATGRHSRGNRPLIFSTELARSAKENIKDPQILRGKLGKLQEKIDQAKNAEAKQKARDAFNKLVNTIERSIAVYGAINLRTDGTNVVIAQKIERPRRKDKEWDIYVLKGQPDGSLRYESKHG